MGWRTVIVDSRCKLSFKNDYILLKKEEDVMVHISEIDVLVIATTQVNMTCVALSELIRHKVKVIFCDERHDPICEAVACNGCHNGPKRLASQIAWDEHVKGEIFSAIIRGKIRNQATLLRRIGEIKAADMLEEYAVNVKHDDITNREGHAAKVYFNALFGKGFKRDDVTPVNYALNYGYSVLLSVFNREVVANGCVTQLGIHHRNEFSNFNLSCDLIEPFRVLIDEYVNEHTPGEILTKEYKYDLIGVLGRQVEYEKNVYLTNAVAAYVRSALNALESGDVSAFKMYEF